MNLDEAKSRGIGARRGSCERALQRNNAFRGEFLRQGVVGRKRNGAGRDGSPSPGGLRDLAAARPGPKRAALAAGMRELNRRDRALPVDETRDPLQRFEMPF